MNAKGSSPNTFDLNSELIQLLNSAEGDIINEGFLFYLINSSEAFFMATPDLQHFHYISPAYETIWGRPRDELYESPVVWLKSIYHADRRKVAQIAKNHSQYETQHIFEYRIRRPDGEIRWIEGRVLALRNENGEHYRSAGYSDDITEKKQAEESLQQANTELEQRITLRTEELISVNAQMAEKERFLTATHEMGKSVLDSIDLEEVLDSLGEHLVTAGQFRSLMIALVDDEDRAIEVVRGLTRFAGANGVLDKPTITYRREGRTYPPDGNNIIAEVARTGHIEIIDGWDDRFDTEIEKPTDSKIYNDKISYFLPIKHGKRVLGVIATANTRRERNEHVRSCQSLQKSRRSSPTAHYQQSAFAPRNCRAPTSRNSPKRRTHRSRSGQQGQK